MRELTGAYKTRKSSMPLLLCWRGFLRGSPLPMSCQDWRIYQRSRLSSKEDPQTGRALFEALTKKEVSQSAITTKGYLMSGKLMTQSFWSGSSSADLRISAVRTLRICCRSVLSIGYLPGINTTPPKGFLCGHFWTESLPINFLTFLRRS